VQLTTTFERVSFSGSRILRLPDISAVICSHNPRPDYLRRVLNALADQTLPLGRWELLLVDNASQQPLAAAWDISWHPNGRHIREDELGLTPARLRGIAEARAALLVLVDDDNVLARDYLERALSVSEQWPILGTWGGQILPEFEQMPEDWTRRYWNWIAIRQFERNRWSNLPEDRGDKPYGAGICVRQRVAESYAARVANDPLQRLLDRKGSQLLGGGDTDLCLTACNLGLGNGIFVGLKLTHLIPARRLEESYLLELVEAMTCSNVLLNYLMGTPLSRSSRSQRLLRWYESWHLPKRERRFQAAKQRGAEAAFQEIQRLQQG
jgi:glycosyltransferase involved in cell wall biosynthesis